MTRDASGRLRPFVPESAWLFDLDRVGAANQVTGGPLDEGLQQAAAMRMGGEDFAAAPFQPLPERWVGGWVVGWVGRHGESRWRAGRQEERGRKKRLEGACEGGRIGGGDESRKAIHY
jgi:hypothetical protein